MTNTIAPQIAPESTATPTEIPVSISPVNAALEGIGGAEALNNLLSLVIESGVMRRARGEGLQPDFEPGPPIMMTLASTHDVASTNLRLDFVREGQNTKSYSEILAGDLGYMVGTDANFGGGDGSNTSSDRWAASHKHNRLTNPLLILRDALADSSIVSDGGLSDAREIAPGIFRLAGSSHNSLAIEQANGIVIVEAPFYPERSEAIIDWVSAAKATTHLIPG